MNSSQHNLDQTFFVAGVNYRTAPVEIRERMAVAHPDRIEVSRMLQLKAGLSEVVVLWTCNRVEIYGVAAQASEVNVARMFECLAREAPSLSSHVYCHRGQEALRHLFKVVSGLDSMVMGETQITGQVRDAYEAARKQKLTGKILNSVFQKALQTAKAVRTQTSIGRGARSVGGVAVAHAREVLGSRGLKKHAVLMIGAGEMASCCLRHLQKKGECSVVVANRSFERAQQLAAEFNGSAVPFGEMYEAMADADVVISSTGSPNTVINRKELEPAMRARADRPLVIIDIAVPRDVAPDVIEVEGVHLHDIDALESTVQQTMGRWENDFELCEGIIGREIDNLNEQFKSRSATGSNRRHFGLKALSKASLCALLIPVALCWVSAPALAAESSDADFSGTLRGTYDYRGLGDFEDQDAYAYWYLRGRNLADRHVDFYTSGRFHSDLDGTGPTFSDDPFISLEDTSRNDEVRLLQLYMEMHDQKNTMALRIGRQYVDVVDYIQMTGVQGMLFENQKLGGRVFLGEPSSYYSSTSGDLFGGASLVGRPWDGNRSRITYARYEDDDVSEADNHYIIDVRQQILEELRTRAYLSVMNEDVRMGSLDLYYMSLSDRVFDAELGIRRWGDYRANTRAYSPLVQALGDLNPYTTGYGRFTTELLSWLYLSPGVYLRYPDDSDATNRGYERYDVSLIFEATEAWNASIALEYWDVEDDDRFFGVTGDIRYRYRKDWEVSLGAAYLDYTYFQFSDFAIAADGGSVVVGDDGTRMEVSPYAFTYFLRGKWNITKNLSLRLSGEIEDDSEEDDLGYRVRSSVEVRL